MAGSKTRAPRHPRYEILRKLGSGGNSSVFLARDRFDEGREVALKISRLDVSPTEILRELRILRQLRHPGIARAFDCGRMPSSGAAYFTLEYIPGPNLQVHTRLLRREGGSAARARIISLFLQVTSALAYLHQKGILHLDIKPANAVLSDGRVKLIDFGLFQSSGAGPNCPPRGTAYYMAPEVIDGGPVDLRADLYSLGITLYRSLTGRFPIPGRTVEEIAANHGSFVPPPPPGLPESLSRVILKMLAKSPRHRFQSARDVADALRAAVPESADVVDIPFDEPDFVGRKSELDSFFEWIDGVKRGSSQRVLIFEGEAGIGKSRLVEACATEMLDLDMQVVPIRTLGGRGPDGLKQLVEKLLLLLPRSTSDGRGWPFLLTFLGIARDSKSLREIKDLDAASIQSRVLHEAFDLLSQSAQKPLVFLIEDLTAADPYLLRFVAGLGREQIETSRRVGVMATRGSAKDSVSTVEELDAEAVGIVRVKGLTREEATAVLACVAPELSTAAAADIVKESRGNPAVLLERLRESRLPGGRGEKVLRPATPASEALELAHRAKIKDLPPTERKALLTLALSERPLSEPEARGAAELDPIEWRRTIRALARAGLTGGLKAGYYALPGARAAAGSSFDPEEISWAHARLGSRFLKDPRRQSEAAHHLLRAGELQLGLEAAERGVQSLRAAGRIEEAIVALRDALDHAGQDQLRARLLERLGELEEKCGRFDAAGAAFGEARELVGGEPASKLRLLRKLGGIHQRRGENEAAGKAFEEALGLVEEAADLDEPLCLYQELSAFHLFRGDFARASTFANRGLEILASDRARSLGKEALAHHALNFHSAAGHVFLRQFEYARASAELEEGLRHADRLGAVSSAALLWNNLGIARSQDNRLREALEAYRHAAELSKNLGDTTAVFSIQCNVATLRARLGETHAAEEALRIASEMPHAGKSLRAKLFLTHTRGLIERIFLRDAQTTWEAAIELADELPDPLFAAYGRLCLLENELQFGRWASARALGEKLAASKRRDARFDRALGARLACLAALCGQQDEARAILESSVGLQEATLYVDLWDSVYQGQALLELGDLDAAEDILRRAQEAFASSRQAPSTLECSLLLADLALRRRDVPSAVKSLRIATRSLASLVGQNDLRRASVRVPYLEARAELISARGNRESFEDRLADAKGSLELDTTSELVWLLALVSAETGHPARKRKAHSARRSFVAHLAEGDRAAYIRRDHRVRLGLQAQQSTRETSATETQATRRYDAMVKLAQIHQPSQALQVILDAVGARMGAVFLSDAPRAAAAHGLGKLGEAAIEKLRGQALRADTRECDGKLCIPLRVHSRAKAVLYVDPGTTELDCEALRFLETAAALLANAIPSVHRAQEVPRDSTLSLGATRGSTLALPSEAYMQTKSPRMRELVDLIVRTRGSDLPVLIVGESGVGKDHLARWIHSLSPRAKGPFVAQDCAAVPEGLLEADIFGYETGAFTGADRSKTGYIFAAHGGTYYIDNVDSLSLEVQAKLLRVLEEKSVRPLGGNTERKMDVRFIASSQRDLKEMSLRGELRKDLYYRLAGISLHVPPLRERAEDIPLLVRQVQRQIPGRPLELKPSAIDALRRYSWPGNIRELEAVVRRLAVTAEGPVDEARVAQVLGLGDATPSFPRWLFEGKTFEQAIEEVKREYLLEVFERHQGDLTTIAKEMRTTKRNVYFRFAQVGIKPVDLRGGRA